MANKFTPLIVATCGLVALGTGLYCHRQMLESQQALLAASRDVTRLEASLKRLPDQQAQTQAQIDELKQAERDRQQAAQATAAETAPSPQAPTAEDAFLRAFRENPELRQALTKNAIADYKLHYAAIFKALGLSDAQIDQLSDLHAKLQTEGLDVTVAARLAGKENPSSDPGVQAQYRQLWNSAITAETAIVGPDAEQQIRNSDRSYGAQGVANQVAASTYSTPTPLTPGQADELTQILQNNSPSYRQGGGINLNNLDWNGVLKQATGILPAPQIAVLQTIRASQALQRDTIQAATAAQAANKGTP